MKRELVEEIAVDNLGLDLKEVRQQIKRVYDGEYEQYFFDQIWGELNDINERAVVLAEFLNEDFATALSYVENEDYLVLTDDEADNRWEDSIYSYIDDCVLPEIPESYQYYFDKDRFANDCRMDGRGHSLASYDGREHWHQVGDCDYYIYKIN